MLSHIRMCLEGIRHLRISSHTNHFPWLPIVYAVIFQDQARSSFFGQALHALEF